MNTTRNISATPVDVEALRGHTPAPWQVGDGGKYDPPTMVYCDDSLGSRVADLSMTGHGIPAAVDLINARLIAAAPDLLAEVISRRSRDAAVAELVEAAEECLRAAPPDAAISVNRLRNALLDLAAPGSLAAAAYRGGAPE